MRERQQLVLIPGLVCDRALWSNQLEHLDDLVQMTVPPVARETTMQDMAAAVLAAAPGQFALAGFSMGGYVAMEMLRQAPERITRLAVLDSAARADDEAKAAGRRSAIEACERGEYARVIETMIGVLMHLDQQKGPLAGFVRAMAERVGPDTFVRRHRAMMTRSDSRALLANAGIPIRVICGRQDAMTPLADHEEIGRMAPTARVSVIEDCGHMSPLERPHAVSALMRDWLIYG